MQRWLVVPQVKLVSMVLLDSIINLQFVYFNCNFIDLFNSLLRLDFYIELQKLIYIDYQHKITVPIKMIHFMGRIFVYREVRQNQNWHFQFYITYKCNCCMSFLYFLFECW